MELTVSSTTAALQRLTSTGRARMSLIVIAGVLVGGLAFLSLAKSPAQPPVSVIAGAAPVITYPTWSAHYQALKERWDNPGGKADFSNVPEQGGTATALYPTWNPHYQALKERWDNPGGKADFSDVLAAER